MEWPTQPVTPALGGHPMESWISTVLRVGVLISGAIIATGLAMLLTEGPGKGEPGSLAALRAQGSGAEMVHPLDILQQALAGQPSAVIQLGVLALILTPVTRVAMTLALFIAQRDRVFEAITAVVLIVLVLGLLGAGA